MWKVRYSDILRFGPLCCIFGFVYSITYLPSVNRIDQLFKDKTTNKKILSIFYTAGYPALNDTLAIAAALEAAGADMLEIGMPFSDPLADGPTIQQSNQQSIEGGMSLHLLMEQLKELRPAIKMPVILMGYLNPVLQYGLKKFISECKKLGVDGVILPDLPPQEFDEEYKTLFEEAELHFIFLVTPRTTKERVKRLAKLSSGFLYAVATAGTTGSSQQVVDNSEYFKALSYLDLDIPIVAGFNIKDKASFEAATAYCSGGIVGSAFIKALDKAHKEEIPLEKAIGEFVKTMR